MKFELFVAFRYLVTKRKQAMIPVISAISVAGIAAGVAAMIISLALSTGFKEEIQSKILGATSHINLLKADGSAISDFAGIRERIKDLSGVVSVTPGIYDQVFLSSGQRSHGAVLKGIDPSLEQQTTELFGQIIAGDVMLLLARPGEEGLPPGILLGKELAGALGVRVGDTIRAYSPKGPLSPMGPAPMVRLFKVVSVFSSGLWDYDSNWGYISLDAAQRMFSLPAGSVSTIEVRVQDIYAVEELSDRISAALGHKMMVTHWIELNRPLFAALKLEKLAMFVTVCLIVLVAAFNIVTTLIMMVMEKNKDIAIFSAMGVQEGMILKVFMFEGLILGFCGTAIGCITGIATSLLLDRYKVIRLAPEVYSIPYVPFRIVATDVVYVACAAILISFVATLYPARAAARLRPVEAMRYE